MLTSSDAKWRCMWHMLVWSILLTLVSQFLTLLDHIAFYIFASLCMIVLPVLTAVYSNTSGRRGAGLIRVAYVICDPVLACISITPVLLLNHLPFIAAQYSCLVKSQDRNTTCDCIMNHTSADNALPCVYSQPFTDGQKALIIRELSGRFVVIQMSVATPILISLLMGRRTSKMSLHTCILTFAYWFVVGIESVDMLQTILVNEVYQHVVYTTMAIISISMIITNSYAIVTLCSFISPRSGQDSKQMNMQFDFIYRVLVGCSGILFTEIPLLVARSRILRIMRVQHISWTLSATFFLWLFKDLIFICLIVVVILAQKMNRKYVAKLPCKMNFDNTDIIFQPEKRDAYIERKKSVRFQDPPATMFCEERKGEYSKNNDMSKKKSVLKNANSSQWISSNNNSKEYGSTDGTGLSTDNVPDTSRVGSVMDVRQTVLSLPLTDHPDGGLSSSPRLSIGARPKLNSPKMNCALIHEVKSRPQPESDSDSDPL